MSRTFFHVIVVTILSLAGIGCIPAQYIDPQIPTQSETSLQQIDPLALQPVEEPNEPAPVEEPNEPAPERMEVTLEQCRALALEGNLELKTQLIAPTISAEQVNEERSRFEAAFTSNINYIKTDTAVSSSLELEGNQRDTMITTAGVQAPLPTGGTITVQNRDSRSHTNSAFSIFNPSYSPGASASLSQPLLQNAGIKTNTYAIRVAALNRRITNARTRLDVIRIIAALDRVYWRLYAAQKALEVRNQQLDLANAQLNQAKRQVEQGVSPQVEIIRAEAGVAQQLEAIIVAENDLADRQRELKRVINKANLGMQSRTRIAPLTEPIPQQYQFNPDTLVANAVQHRMEYLEIQLQLAQDADTIQYLKNQALPVATLNYTYNVNGLGDTRANAYDLLSNHRFVDHTLGLQLVVPLGNAAAASRVRRAQYEKFQRLIQQKDRESLIEYEVLNALNQVESNWQRILASQQNTLLNSRVYEAEKRQFEQGMRTSTDVLDAQTTLADAQLAELSALVEYQIALVDLAYATGTLLGAAHIEWSPVVPAID